MPGPIHRQSYNASNSEKAPDGRLFAPSFERNSTPIIATLKQHLGDASGQVLEIGCGTGQHVSACALAMPHLAWQASDPYPQHRASADAWATHLATDLPPAIDLDAAQEWAPQVAELSPVRAVISMNVIHIAPFIVTEGIIAGAAKVLAKQGLLIFYGPFRVDGKHTSQGNIDFDAALRRDNPDWGIRDISELEAIATPRGLILEHAQPMPANNRTLIFRKS